MPLKGQSVNRQEQKEQDKSWDWYGDCTGVWRESWWPSMGCGRNTGGTSTRKGEEAKQKLVRGVHSKTILARTRVQVTEAFWLVYAETELIISIRQLTSAFEGLEDHCRADLNRKMPTLAPHVLYHADKAVTPVPKAMCSGNHPLSSFVTPVYASDSAIPSVSSVQACLSGRL